MPRRRGVQRHRETEEERQLAEQRAKREAARELGAFLMEADELAAPVHFPNHRSDRYALQH
jgi:hypothetical protein